MKVCRFCWIEIDINGISILITNENRNSVLAHFHQAHFHQAHFPLSVSPPSLWMCMVKPNTRWSAWSGAGISLVEPYTWFGELDMYMNMMSGYMKRRWDMPGDCWRSKKLPMGYLDCLATYHVLLWSSVYALVLKSLTTTTL